MLFSVRVVYFTGVVYLTKLPYFLGLTDLLRFLGLGVLGSFLMRLPSSVTGSFFDVD